MSGSEPLVAVVVPVYNGAEFLRECLDSVLRQTYRNWRLIIVDNSSTDGSREIAAEFAGRDERVQLVACDTFLSQVENWNRTQDLIPADAVYAKWLCADDWLFPECLTRMVAVGERYPSTVLISAYRVDDRQVNLDGLPVDVEFVPGRELGRAALLGELEYIFGSSSSVLVRHGSVQRTPFWDPDIPYFDLEMFYETLRHGDFGFVHQVLTYTRRHEGAISAHRGSARLTADQIRTLLAHGDYFLSPAEYERRIAVKLVLHTKQLLLETPTEWAAEPHRGMRRRLDWGVVARGLRQQLGRTLRREHTPRWEPTDHPVPSGH